MVSYIICLKKKLLKRRIKQTEMSLYKVRRKWEQYRCTDR